MKNIVLISIAYLFTTCLTNASVTAIYNNDVVEITWSNPYHTNIDYFVVERSKNARVFSEVVRVDGPLDHNTIHDYYEIDTKPFKKRGYYRIKQVDENGNIYYSEVVFAKKNQNQKQLSGLFSSKDMLDKKLKNYSEKNVLVVLIDKNRNEYIAKVDITEEKKKLIRLFLV